MNQEAKELEAAGVDIIQFDEPAFNVFFDEMNDWGIAALERAIKAEMRNGGTYLLWIWHQSEHRLEKDVGHRVASI